MTDDAFDGLIAAAFFGPILLVATIALLIWLWFKVGHALDRRYLNRMRDGRCWKCNYKLCGIISDRCPECGMPITRPYRSPSQ